MKQIPMEFARAGWTGQRPMTRQELREKKRRIEQKANYGQQHQGALK